MKFSEAWLREWVNPPVNTKQLTEQLTMSGLEVDSVTPVANDFTGVLVGSVLAVEQHPNADRLRVCQVDIGNDEILTVVCGATNVRANLKVAVATIGAQLSPEFTIKPAKLRGVSSQGMICSAEELGLAQSSEGILELPDDAPMGRDFRSYLNLEDNVIEVDLTPNRGDCLSVLGIAREVAAINALDIPKLPDWQVKPECSLTFPVDVIAKEDCPHYVGRVIRGISMNVQTPLWLKERLRRSGMRSIHVVVDVTNYVLMELGQPLHAFDLNKLTGSLFIRRSEKGEELTLLDGRTISLDAKNLVIADEKRPLALAGIMGGLHSAITTNTQEIFLESAFFNPLTLSGCARSFGLSTDASHRFERFVSPDLQEVAIERATQLLLEIAGGIAGPLIIFRDENFLPRPVTILLRKKAVDRVLGINLSETEIEALLQCLNMQLKSVSEEAWEVKPPLYRADLQQEIDLLEEIARIYGYERIMPVSCPPTVSPDLQQNHEIQAEIASFLQNRGYHEAITYSFVDPRIQALFATKQAFLAIKNPISSELSSMRTTLWPGLLKAVAYNQSHQQPRVRLFEMGLRFVMNNTQQLEQQSVLAGVVTDTRSPQQWGVQTTPVDFFDIKADLEGLFALTGQGSDLTFRAGSHAALHPGQTAEIFCQNESTGYIGALHPQVVQQLGLAAPIYVFEILLSSFSKKESRCQALSRFPAVRRDLAVVVDQTIAAIDLLNKVRRVGGEQLIDVWIFDVYQGKGISSSQKSLAIGLIWQHNERTLLDDEISLKMQAIIEALQTDFNAVLRN